MNNRYLNLLGLAFRAGKCSIGEEIIIRDIRHNRVKLVLLANDIGRQTKKRLTDKCHSYKIPIFIVHDADTISHAIGKQKRVAVAILEEGFAEKMQTLLG